MAKEKETEQSGGICVLGLLGVVFVTLKLCGVINWSWWWVTAPFWGVLAIVIVLVIASVLVSAAINLLEANNKSR